MGELIFSLPVTSEKSLVRVTMLVIDHGKLTSYAFAVEHVIMAS